MNSIDNLKLDLNQGIITVILHTDIELDLGRLMLCVDECWNYENIESDNINDHNYTFCAGDSEITITSIEDDTCLNSSEDESHYKLTIHNLSICDFDINIKYFRLLIVELTDADYDDYGTFFADYLYYNPYLIYQAEISTIHKYCQSCLDDLNMLLIVYVTFKRQLLENAIQLNDSKMALSIYVELCRTLGVTLDLSKGNNLSEKSQSTCNVCLNGICNIN